MAHEIVIPRLGWSMEEGTFVGWLKKDGDYIKQGEPVFELEGEKAAQEIEAVDDGILRIPTTGPAPGSIVKVGVVVGYLVAPNEPTPTATESREIANLNSVPTQFSSPEASASGSFSNPLKAKTAFASPRARRVAAEMGIDWTQLLGSGVGGRIRESDVRDAAERITSMNSAAGNGQRIPHTKLRRVIAQRLVTSRRQTVPVTLTTKLDATNIVSLRDQFKSAKDSVPIPSFQDIIIKLVAEVLKGHRLLASRWDEDAILLPPVDELHFGIAVDTEDGLLVPVVHNVAQLSLTDLARESRRLIDGARAGSLVAADMQGGVFTISNLGAFGIDAFTPIINLPEAAILGIGAIRREPTVLDDGRIVARQQLTLSLTFDHRIVDGAYAARFLKTLVSATANPLPWPAGPS